MFDNLKKDKLTNNSPINLAGLKALRVYRFGRWRMTIKSSLLRAPLSFLYQQLEKHVRFKYGIELPYTVVLGDRVRFEHQHGIVIHGNACIGNNCIIRQGVTIGNKNMSAPFDAPHIGDNVNIGAGAKILGAISIGNNVIIGANAVVTKDVPDNAIAVGIPAKIIKPTKN
jgi:serine O-acetyltransferase